MTKIQDKLITLAYQMLHLKRNRAKIIYHCVMQIELLLSRKQNNRKALILRIQFRFDNPKVKETTIRPTET
jgi:hypothetical protein